MNDPVVLVPGMMCDARIFLPQIVELSPHHTVLVPSMDGMDTIREMALRTLENAPDRFALVGLSMGGIIAMEMMRQAPELISRIALISTSPLAETPAQSAWREPQIAKARAGILDQAIEAAVAPENLAPGASRTAALALLKDMAADLGAETFVAHSRALQRRRDAQKVLLKINVPALILCGAHDKLTPVKRHEAMAELIPSSELVVLDNAGHLPTIEAPEATNDVLNAWLGRPLMLR